MKKEFYKLIIDLVYNEGGDGDISVLTNEDLNQIKPDFLEALKETYDLNHIRVLHEENYRLIFGYDMESWAFLNANIYRDKTCCFTQLKEKRLTQPDAQGATNIAEITNNQLIKLDVYDEDIKTKIKDLYS